MIGLNRRREMGKPKMVMVEYLKSSGDAFIDTGITATSNNLSIRFKIRFEVPDVNRRILIGCYELNLLSINLEVYKSGSNNVMRTYSARGSSAINNVDTVALPLNKEIEVDAIANFTLNTFNCEYTFEETSHTFNKSLVSGFTNTYKTFILFSDNRTGAGIRPQIANSQLIYSALIYVDDVLVRDFIPVRIGLTGYMYDKVSNKLFGNKGTGTFILGLDIIPVEYLLSSGTLWVDTGVNFNSIVSATVKMSISKTITSNNVLFGAFYDNSNVPKFQIYISSQCKWGAVYNGLTYSGFSASGTVSLNTLYTLTITTREILNSDVTILIFKRNNDKNDELPTDGMCLYSTKITYGGNLIRDFIPVRINLTGYLYDKISNLLFANAGTGDFILGPDKEGGVL